MESSNFQTTSSVNDDNYIQESVAFSIDSNKEPSFLQMLTAQKSSPSICSSSTAGRKVLYGAILSRKEDSRLNAKNVVWWFKPELTRI